MAKKEATLLLNLKTKGEKTIEKTRAALNKLGKAAAVAFAGLTAIGVKAVAAYKEQELSVNKLNQSLIQQGVYTKELSKEYQNMASDLQKTTTFGDEAIISAQAQLQSYLGQEKITKELTQATLDFAAAMKVDLKTASRLVGQSIGSQTNALTRYGIQIDTSATKSEKLAAITKGLSGQFGGQAAAAAQGLGSLEQFSNAFGDLFEVIGKALAPVIGFFTKQLTSLAVNLQENDGFIRGLNSAVAFLARGFVGLKLTSQIVFSILKAGFMEIATFVSNIASGEFKAALTEIGDATGKAFDEIGQAVEDRAKEMAELDRLFDEKEQERQENKTAAMQEEQAKRNAILQEEMDKRKAIEDKALTDKKNNEAAVADVMNKTGLKVLKDNQSNLGNLSSLQQSKMKEIAAVGKAASLAQITVNTAENATEAMKFGTRIGGPVLGFPMAAATIAFGAEQAAAAAGVKLAEGGIVKATPGGVPAIVGEGGRDEAVIPLDEGGANVGTTINLEVQGGFLGDENQAKEWAKTLDLELFRLRQSNESVAFDRGII